MSIVTTIESAVLDGVKSLYDADVSPSMVTINSTRKEFEGDFTVVTFPFAKLARKKPDQIAEDLGAWLLDRMDEVSGFNVIKGFLNLSLSDTFWTAFMNEALAEARFGQEKPGSASSKVMVEFSSPNTNKPLHLGHIRNILLGWSTSRILEALGHEVVRVQVINDRGIAICKSMLAWQKYGEGKTPGTSGIKGDHLVGEFYVLFEKKFQEEYARWQKGETAASVYREKAKATQTEEAFFKTFKNTYFNEFSALGREARDMLLKWEAGDETVVGLWKKMNGWVYDGFETTYRALGVSFDRNYFESNTYLSGKDIVEEGLEKGLFYRKDDGSVWIDLEDAKLDHKLLLRSDGTSVYMTQDLGTARMRWDDFGAERMVYVVADEQNYHFQVLFEICKRMGEPYADGLYHLSYGMVDLTTGKMKSREGTVVDADDLVADVLKEAEANSRERGTLEGISAEEAADINRKVGLAALKFFILKVHPKKRMVFDPKDSVDLQGQTGPYVQYPYVRIQSVLRKAGAVDDALAAQHTELLPAERELLSQLYAYPAALRQAAEEYDPSTVANYLYDLAKGYNKFWHDHPMLQAEPAARAFRLRLSELVARVLAQGLDLLGIEVPERM